MSLGCIIMIYLCRGTQQLSACCVTTSSSSSTCFVRNWGEAQQTVFNETPRLLLQTLKQAAGVMDDLECACFMQ